jgi:group I intron endonuclease
MRIYLIVCLITGLSYVGQTTQSTQRRWGGHKTDVHIGRNKSFLHNAMLKYGAENFTVRTMLEVGTKEELDYYERALIKSLNTRAPHGYNLTDGGEGSKGYKHTTESRRRLRLARIGKKPALGHAAWNKGKTGLQTSWNKGGSISEDTKAKISASWTPERRVRFTELRKTWIARPRKSIL